MENKLSAFFVISKLLLCTINNVLEGLTLLHLALQWKRKLRRLSTLHSVVNSFNVSFHREPLAFNERKCYLTVLCSCTNCYREISNTLRLFLRESAFITDVTSSSFRLWLWSFLFAFSLPVTSWQTYANSPERLSREGLPVEWPDFLVLKSE